MFTETNKYKQQGHFFFQKGNSLTAQSSDVPDLHGVYYIMRLANGKIDLVYVGRSGSITQSGKLKEQTLNGRINNKQNGMKRQLYFEQKMTEENIEALDIYWFVTMDNENRDLPGYVEGLLMQRYFDVYGNLPPWNKCF